VLVFDFRRFVLRSSFLAFAFECIAKCEFRVYWLSILSVLFLDFCFWPIEIQGWV
jgi:hypothetical protein